MVADSLPIQKFPDMPLMKIFGFMRPRDLIFLTQTSMKTKALIRRNSKTTSINVMLVSDPKGSHVSLTWGEPINTNIQLIITKAPAGHVDNKDTLKFHKKPFGCILYCAGLYSGYCAVINFLRELYFIEYFSINSHSNAQNEMKLILQFAKTVGLKLDYVELTGSLYCGKSNNQLLNECNEAGTVYLNKPEICEFDDLKVNRLTLKNPKNFDIDSLLSTLHCRSVVLLGAQLPPSNLNEFLNIWKNGSFKLNEFELDREYDLSSIVDGLDATSIESAVFSRNRVQKFEPNKCYRFKKTDGTNAMVYCHRFKFILCLHNE